MSILITSILIISITFIIYGEIRKWFIKRKLGNFDSPKHSMPILGVAGRFIGKSNDEFIDIMLNITKEAKSTPVYAWFGPILFIAISEPEDIQIILSVNLTTY